MYAFSKNYVHALSGTILLDAQVGKTKWKAAKQGVESFAVTSQQVSMDRSKPERTSMLIIQFESRDHDPTTLEGRR